MFGNGEPAIVFNSPLAGSNQRVVTGAPNRVRFAVITLLFIENASAQRPSAVAAAEVDPVNRLVLGAS